MPDQGMYFDGVMDRVLLGLPEELGIYDCSYTIELRFCPRSASGAILGCDGYGEPEGVQPLYVYLGYDGLPQVGWRIPRSAVTALSKDVFYHLAIRYDKTTRKMALFIKATSSTGSPTKTEVENQNPYLGTGRIYLGMPSLEPLAGSINGLACHIAELRIWSCARTDDEIANNVGAELTGDEKWLARHLQLSATTQGAVQLDGANGYVTLPPMDIDFSQGMTFEAWVYYEQFKSYSRLCDLGCGAPSDNIVITNPGNSTSLALYVFRGTTEKSIAATNALVLNTWMHLSFSIDPSGLAKIYKNGQLLTSGQLHLPDGKLRTKNFLGKSNWEGDGLLQGKLAEVRLWNVARTQQQIQAHMKRRLVGNEKGLRGYWKLDEGAGISVLDSSGNGVHGTRNSEVLWTDEVLPLSSARPEVGVTEITGKVTLPAQLLDVSAGLACEAWVYLLDNGQYGQLLSIGDSESNGVLFMRGGAPSGGAATDPPTFGLYVGNAAIYSKASVETNCWVHLAASVDKDGLVTLYKNGAVVEKAQTYGTVLPTGKRNYLQCSVGNSLRALLSELRLWTVPRSQREIQRSMRRRLTGKEPGLALYYRLDEQGRQLSPANLQRTLPPIEDQLGDVSTVTHEGKVLVFACAGSGSIKYTVRQSGYENSAVQGKTSLPGWEDWKEVDFPDEDDDKSVTAQEAKDQIHDSEPGRYFMRSRYRSAWLSEVAPVQAVSANGHLYLFRQSQEGTLLCDRFVLDGMTNQLLRKLEVRYKRSGQRFSPGQPEKREDGKHKTYDSVDFSDSNGKSFYEPTTELCFANGLHDGLFAPVLVETNDADRPRWHFFVHRQSTGKIEVISVRSSKEGLFDPHDHASSLDGTLVPGIQRTALSIPAPVQGLTASRYDEQREQITASGEKQLLRTAVRIMLAAATPKGTYTLSFAIAADGTLAKLAESGTQKVLHSHRQELIMPVDTLEGINTVTVSQVSGSIVRMERGAGDLLRITTQSACPLSVGDRIRLEGTRSYNQRYQVVSIDGSAVVLDTAFVGAELGQFTRVDAEETGATWTGAIAGYQQTSAGKLQLTAHDHGLAPGKEVQVIDTTSYNKTYAVKKKIDDTHFLLESLWATGTAQNIEALAQKRRRGVLFANNSYISVPGALVPRGNGSYTIEAWIKPTAMGALGIAGWGNFDVQNQATVLRLHPGGILHAWGGNDQSCQTADLSNQWHHVAATYDQQTRKRCIYLDGVLKAEETLAAQTVHAVPSLATKDNFTIGVTAPLEFFSGELAEVRIWSRARTADELSAMRYLSPSGTEAELVSYFRLGAILEGSPRRVLDFSSNGKNGTVVGGCSLSCVRLVAQPSARYRNSGLISVMDGGVYEESFEARGVNGPLPNLSFNYWFKKSRDSLIPDATLEPIAATVTQTTDAAQGWRRICCQYKVPPGMSFVRVFDISDAGGVIWSQIELRNHRLCLLPEGVSEWTSVAPISVDSNAEPIAGFSAYSALIALEQKEAALMFEKRLLDERIYAKDNSSGLDAEIARLQAAITDKENLRKYYENLRSQRFIYNCTYVARHSGKLLEVPPGADKSGQGLDQFEDRRALHETQPPSCQQFYAEPTSNDFFKLISWCGKPMTVQGASKDNDAKIVISDPAAGNDDHQQFKFEPVSADEFTLRIRHSGHVVDVAGENGDNGAGVIQFPGNGGDNQIFKIARVDQAESKYSQQVLDALNACILALRQLRADLEQQQAAKKAQGDVTLYNSWVARRTILTDVTLPTARDKANQKKNALRSYFASTPANVALTNISIDGRALKVRGALLTSVRPGSRLTSLFTSQGEVALSYLDTRGCVRQAIFDAAVQSGIATADTWRPESLRACVDFSSAQQSGTLSHPIPLGSQWTIEAWFLSPLPKTDSQNTLVAGEDGCHFIVFQNGKHLGCTLREGIPATSVFYSSGFDISQLRPGWHHLAVVAEGSGAQSTTVFYLDGQRVGDLRAEQRMRKQAARSKIDPNNSAAYQLADKELKDLDRKSFVVNSRITRIGNGGSGGQHCGRIAELRVWGLSLDADEVAMNAISVLSGREPGLLAYYPLRDGAGAEMRDYSGNSNHVTLPDTTLWQPCGAPIAVLGDAIPIPTRDAVVGSEYSTIGIRPGTTDEKYPMMRRFLAVESRSGLRLFSDQRVEELELLWVGNAQYQPTLLGFIEGAPPVPSENLTIEDNYNGATSVELTMSSDTSYSWSWQKSDGDGAHNQIFFGVDSVSYAGVGVMTKLGATKFGLAATVDNVGTETDAATVTSSSSAAMTDRLALRGQKELQPRFAKLGPRFIPKNVGYALVISGLADVFITRLRKSGRMVGYQVIPTPDVPLDINTISFLINPTYTMNGSLDGMTGSAAASQQYYPQVPSMRAQFGSLYPASYYRLDEAYALKNAIEADDKRRESYFANFDARSNKQWFAEGLSTESAPAPITTTAPSGSIQAAPAASTTAQQQEQIDKRRSQISAATGERGFTAQHGLSTWIARLDAVRQYANKRNIVNTYVWDADGGLRSEAEQFASTIQYSIGCSLSVTTNVGLQWNQSWGAAATELTSQHTHQTSQVFSKNSSKSQGFALQVNLDGVESRGVTDYNDVPIAPGEKVSRYRFLSFFLEGSTKNFNDFFQTVVDPQWLQGNSEGARALRQVDRRRANKAWRILHRVTYVERPALSGFGDERRPVVDASQAPSLEQRVDALEAKIDRLLMLAEASQPIP